MADPSQPSLTAEQVLQDIANELRHSEPPLPPMARRMAQLRQLAEKARVPTLTGRFGLIKWMLYRLNRANLNRQYDVNDAILTLVEDIYCAFDRHRAREEAEMLRLRRMLGAASERADTADPFVTHDSILDRMEHDCVADETVSAERDVIGDAPAEMLLPEREVLYGLVRGLKPSCCLEIGTFRGGSALIICAALDKSGWGQLVCVDPEPRISGETWRCLVHRATLLSGRSPEILEDAAQVAGQPFDFVLIDGDHSAAGVLADVEGVLPFLADQATLLFHDAHYFEVEAGIRQALHQYADSLTDCGLVSVHESAQPGGEIGAAGKPVRWGGLRLVRFARHRE